MRLLLIIMLLPIFSIGQFDTTKFYKSPNVGEIFRRAKINQLMIPSDTTTNKVGVAQIGANLYAYFNSKWNVVGNVDTTSLSNRINSKLNISDTLLMLAAYKHWQYNYTNKTYVDSGLSTKAAFFTASAPLFRSGALLGINNANSTTTGALTSTDWNTFNNKVGTSTTISTTAPLQGGGDLSANRTLSIDSANAARDGYLSRHDWIKFNGFVNSTSTVKDSLDYIDISKFGAVGDGSTDNFTLLRNLINAGFKKFYIPKGNFRINQTLVLPDDITFFGDAETSIISISVNDTIFKSGNNCVFNNFKIIGSASSVVKTQVDFGQYGISLDSVFGCNINNVRFSNMRGAAIYINDNGLANNDILRFTGNLINNCFGINNAVGIFADVRGEYTQINNCSFTQGGTGIRMIAGNVSITSGNYSSNRIGLSLSGGVGTNDLHSIASGVTVNHCDTILNINNSLNGYTLNGCMFYYGKIFLNNSTKIKFSNCDIDTNIDTFYVNNTSSSYVQGGNIISNRFKLTSSNFPIITYNNTATTGSSLQLRNPSGSNVTYEIANNNGAISYTGTNVDAHYFPRPVSINGAAVDYSRGLSSTGINAAATANFDFAQFYNISSGANSSGLAVLTNTAGYALRVRTNGLVGIGTGTPNQTLDVAGSFGSNITTTSTNLTLDATHSTIVVTSGTPTITLPTAASSNSRRIYRVINQTGSSVTISAYLDYTGASATTIAANSVLLIQSNGSNWYRIG